MREGAACRLPAAILYAVGRDQLDVDGLGPAAVANLVASRAVTDVSDLFTVTRRQLVQATGGSERLAEKLLAQMAEPRFGRPLISRSPSRGWRSPRWRPSARKAS